MKILNKIVAVLAIIIGFMAVVTGLRVILGYFDPGYTYFITLVSYNVLMGAVSVVAGIYIWQKNSKALYFAYFIAAAHIIVFLLLKTVFKDVISDHSLNAMTFRSVAWIIFTLIILSNNAKLKKKIIEPEDVQID